MFVYSYAAGIRGNYHESSDCFEYPPKNPYLNQATYQNLSKYLPKFSYSKNFLKSKISNPKKSFNHPCHLKSREPPLGGQVHNTGNLLLWYENHTGFT